MQFYDHLGIVTIFIIIRFSAGDVLISGMRSRRQKSVLYLGTCGQHHMHFSLASEISVIWKKKKTTSLQFLKITFFFFKDCFLLPPASWVWALPSLHNPSQTDNAGHCYAFFIKMRKHCSTRLGTHRENSTWTVGEREACSSFMRKSFPFP